MKKRALFILLTALVGILALTIGCSKDDDNGGNGDNSSDSINDYVTDTGGGNDTDTDTNVNYPDSDSEPEYDTAPLPENCDESNYQIEVKKIDMLVVLDRSYSMELDKIWEPMGTALTTVTEDYKEMVNFGLMMFPGQDAECIDPQQPGATDKPCVAPTTPDVALHDESAAQKIAAVFAAGSDVSPCGGTPIADTLKNAKTYFKALEGQKTRYILLATDGAPNCNSEFTTEQGKTCNCTYAEVDACEKNPLNCLDDERTNEATADLYADAGVETYVIGMGEAVNNLWDDSLNAIAAAGNTEEYLPAKDTSKLQEAFETVTQNVVNCNFAIDWDSLSSDASTDKDKINFFCKENASDPISRKNLVGFDDGCAKNTGWDWVNDDTVMFCQGACDRLKRRQCTSVAVTFACEGGTIVVK